MRHLTLPLAIALLAIIAGCAQKPAPPAPDNAAPVAVAPETVPETENAPEAATSPNAPGKVKVVAYINMTSGCQASTVKLINDLAIRYSDFATVEFVDFGDGDKGAQRWADDGLDCMTILFNDSPVLRMPDASGQSKTVVFAMPEGFSWTHDDMQAAFVAMESGKLEILTEEEARRELAPTSVKLDVKVITSGAVAELQINGTPAIKLQAKTADKTAAQRAQAAKAALDKWSSEPISPSQFAIEAQGKDLVLKADDAEIGRITPADVKAAGAKDARTLANTWLKGLSGAIADAARAAKENG